MWRPDTAGATLSGSTRTLEAPQLLTRAGLQSGPEVLPAPPGLSVTSNLPHPAPDFTASSGEIRGSGQKVSAGFGAFYRRQSQGRTRGTRGFRARATDAALGIWTTRIAPSAGKDERGDSTHTSTSTEKMLDSGPARINGIGTSPLQRGCRGPSNPVLGRWRIETGLPMSEHGFAAGSPMRMSLKVGLARTRVYRGSERLSSGRGSELDSTRAPYSHYERSAALTEGA